MSSTWTCWKCGTTAESVPIRCPTCERNELLREQNQLITEQNKQSQRNYEYQPSQSIQPRKSSDNSISIRSSKRQSDGTFIVTLITGEVYRVSADGESFERISSGMIMISHYFRAFMGGLIGLGAGALIVLSLWLFDQILRHFK